LAEQAKTTLTEQLRGVDVIAIVSVTNISKAKERNAVGQEAAAFTADATVERILKGSPSNKIRVKDESEASPLSIESKTSTLGTSRFLVFLKRTGDFYTPIADKGLSPIWGTGLGSDRVTWLTCSTVDEAVAVIQKVLLK
jgi:hypothetical protein